MPPHFKSNPIGVSAIQDVFPYIIIPNSILHIVRLSMKNVVPCFTHIGHEHGRARMFRSQVLLQAVGF
jgi:hypothetical protein